MDAKLRHYTTWLQTAAQISSVVVAIAALVIAINAEKRSETRLQEQLDQAEVIAAANIRPFLTVRIENTIDQNNQILEKAVILENRGIGTAVITKAFASDGFVEVKAIPEVLDLTGTPVFDYFYYFGEGQYLSAGNKLTLVKMSVDTLRSSEGITREEALRLLQEFQDELEHIVLEIEYEDVMGNQQPSMSRSFVGNSQGLTKVYNGN